MNYQKYIAQVYNFDKPQQVVSFITTNSVTEMAKWIEEKLAKGNCRVEIQQPKRISPKNLDKSP